MAGITVATAYVNIVSSSQGLGKSIISEVGEAGDKAGVEGGKRASSKFSSALSTGLKRVGTAGLIGVGLAAGATVLSGFKSAINTQEASAILGGLYGDANLAKETLQGLSDVAKNSPLDYSGYQKAAESLAYAGVQGDQTVTILKNVGAAITAAGGDTQQLTQATDSILKMVNAGKVTLDTLQQLSNANVPILSGLAELYGTSIDTVNKMASAGQVKLDDVLSVMENATGKTFQSMVSANDAATQTFSNQWKIAKDNVAQAIGEMVLPLINKLTPAIKEVSGFVTGSFIPAIGSLSDGFGTFFGWIGKIPGPIREFGAALAGVALVSKIGLMSKLTGAFSAFRGEMLLQKGLASMQGVELSKFGAAASVARSKVSRLGKTLGKASILAAGLVLVKGIYDGFTHVNQAVADVNQSAQDLGQTLAENNGVWDATIQKQYEAKVAGSDAFKALVADGADYGKTLAALTGQSDLYDDAIEEVSAHTGALTVDQAASITTLLGLKEATEDHSQSLTELTRRQTEAGSAYNDARRALNEYDSGLNTATGSLKDYTSTTHQTSDKVLTLAGDADKARAAAKGFGDSWERTGEIVGGSTNPIGTMQTALDEFGQAASDADTRLSFLSMTIDELSGRNISLEEATKNLNDQVRNVADGFDAAAEATDGHVASLLNVDGSINTTTEAGSKLYESVSGYSEAYKKSTSAAFDDAKANGQVSGAIDAARAAADDARKSFIKQAMTSKHLTQPEAEALADKMGILAGIDLPDKSFDVSADDLASGVIARINGVTIRDKHFKITAEWQIQQAAHVSAIQALRSGVADPNHADGGWISGPGTGTSDSILARLSNREYVVNARSAKKFGPLLESINNAPGFASGGAVGPSSQALSGLSIPNLSPTLAGVVGAIGEFMDLVGSTGEAASEAASKTADLSASLKDLRGSTAENQKDRLKSYNELNASEKQRIVDAKANLAELKAAQKQADEDRARSWFRLTRGETESIVASKESLAAAKANSRQRVKDARQSLAEANARKVEGKSKSARANSAKARAKAIASAEKSLAKARADGAKSVEDADKSLSKSRLSREERIRDSVRSTGRTEKKEREALAAAEKAVTDARSGRVEKVRDSLRAMKKANAADDDKIKTASKALNLAKKEAEASEQRAQALAKLAAASAKWQQQQKKTAAALDATVEKLGDARSKLDSLAAASEQLSDSVASSITGSASLSDAWSQGGGIEGLLNTLGIRKEEAAHFNESLGTLSNRGLSSDLLAEIGKGGLSSGALASALAGASDSQLSQVNSLRAQIASVADSAGSTVADNMYDKQIVAQTHEVDRLVDEQGKLRDQLTEQAEALNAAIDAGLMGVSNEVTLVKQSTDRIPVAVIASGRETAASIRALFIAGPGQGSGLV